MAKNTLLSAATGLREAKALERESRLQNLRRVVTRYFIRFARGESTDLENALIILLSTGEWTTEEINSIVIQAARTAFKMHPHKLLLRPHSSPYINPTKHKVNVFALGLVDEEGQTISFVEPGATVDMPHPYTHGGKYSAVAGVAPQLRPVQISAHKDTLLDLNPYSYPEWVSYLDVKSTKCCRAHTMWSDVRQTLLCGWCKKPC